MTLYRNARRSGHGSAVTIGISERRPSGMRRLNGVYTQAFNRGHDRVGHLFQGRYKSILVEREPYLMELCRYVVPNPVRAGLTARVEDWRWSSYRATGLGAKPPAWLDADRCWHGSAATKRRRAPAIAVSCATASARHRRPRI